MGGPWEAYATAPVNGPWNDYAPPPIAIPGEGSIAKLPVGGQFDVAAKALEGIPILGGLVPKAGAAVSALANPVTGVGEKGETFGERYAKNLKVEKARSAAMQEQHPIESTLAGLAGGTAATLPLAATTTGARLLGLVGGGLGRQMAAGAASGAAINAADALTRGGDPLTAGGIGGAIGGAVPPVARGIGALASPVVNTVRGIVNPTEEAARRVGTAIDRDTAAGGAGLTQPQFAAAQAAGAPVNLMDMGGETTRALARSAANTSPEGRQLLNRAIDDRFEQQSGRLTDWLRSTFHYPDAVSQQAAIEQSQRATNNVNYARAMRDGAGGIWSPELERLAGSDAVAAAMKKAASVARDEGIVGGYGAMNPRITFTPDGRMQLGRGPTGAPTYPDLQFWDLTRRQLSNGAQMARRAGDMEQARRLGNFATRLNAELDTHVPSYAAARAGHAAFAGAENALEAGQNFVTAKMQNREARVALMRMTPQERQLFQDGFVDRFVQSLNETGDRRNVLNTIANSPAARERLNIALGPQRAGELEGMLHVEHVMDAARGAIQGNSTTARQLAELGLAGAGGSVLSGGSNPFTDPTAALNAALVYGAVRGGRAGMSAIDHRVAGQVARLLTSNNPAQIRLGMQMLGRNQGLLGRLRHADTAMARAGSAQISAPDRQQQARRPGG